MLSHTYVQLCMYNTGCFVQKHSFLVFSFVSVLFSVCFLGLQYVKIETDIVKLWVSEGGRLNEELNYLSTLQKKYGNTTWTDYDKKHFIKQISDVNLFEIPEDEVYTSGYQVLIQTIEKDSISNNILTKIGLLKHVKLMQELVDMKVHKFGIDWKLKDICFKPGALDINDESPAFVMKSTLERLIPCVWITPIDCFFEGSKPLGPNPPINLNTIPMGTAIRLLIPDLPFNISWSNINPKSLVKELEAVFDIGTMLNFFTRTGIDVGYLNKPCIDPLDVDCPQMSPNYYNSCESIQFLKQELKNKNQTLNNVLSTYIVEEIAQPSSFIDVFATFFQLSDSNTTNSGNVTTKEKECKEYRNAFLRWMQQNYHEASKIFPKKFMPKYPNYGKVMERGCQGFARNVMNWPTDMIMGKIKQNGGSIDAEALQSVILVASPTAVYKRLKESSAFEKLKIDFFSLPIDTQEKLRFKLEKIMQNESNINFSNLSIENSNNIWSPLIAKEVLIAWQRKFTESIYNHKYNFLSNGNEQRTVHPLASTSISDMLAHFCNFNYVIIFFGYFVMLLYAVYSQVRWDGCCLLSINGATGLAFAGVLTVTFASIAGLGLSTWLSIEFNAATTQIVPFLTLGIGVDNMFLLLHNYPQMPLSAKNDEIGMLMKETGMSILMTSVNNILSFLTGTILPIPALRSFCTQSSLLLTFNLIAILTIFPAIISWDLKRKKKGRRDFCCCLTSDEYIDHPSLESPYGFNLSGGILTPAQDLLIVKNSQKLHYHGLMSVDKDDEDEEFDVQPWTLRAFLCNYYIPFLTEPIVKFAVIVICMSLFALGIFGIKNSMIGLELSDVLPENTAPVAFLKARDKYFSFYPMFIILRGENIDFPQQQHLIRRLRDHIGKSKFVVKLDSGEPSERYWLAMFTEWLQGLQQKLDEAQKQGILNNFDLNNNTSPELQIAYSLACSYGNFYDCSRVKQIKLIDDTNTINSEGFYNYLYGWHEYESMFYTVSQASFYPKLHKLRQGKKGTKYRYYIPPAPKPLYSRIPFYLTGLKDTPVIVEMIKEIRAISENYTANGLDNFPNGIAFTFWEQYLDLNMNLIKAIGIISFAVFCVISILLFNPWAACCIIVILLMMTVELAGFLGMFEIKFNPVSAVSLITAVGIGVEFTAHVVFAFLTAQGSRNERMAESIDRVFVPVIHGALSTLLGIIMLGFSEFEFVFKYFFVVMSALIIIGLINGLALFPVLLSLVGPPCEMSFQSKGDTNDVNFCGYYSSSPFRCENSSSAGGLLGEIGIVSAASATTLTKKTQQRIQRNRRRRRKRGDSGDSNKISYIVGV